MGWNMQEDVTRITRPETPAAPERLRAGHKEIAAGAAMLLTLGLGAFSLPGLVPAVKGDQLSKPEVARLTDGFNRARGSLLPVDISSKPQREKLVESLLMPVSKAEHLLELVERGERTLGWLALWDNFDEDGDVASVTAAGFTQIVPLRHTPTKILVPYIPGQPVFVTGEHDGMGGGVTVAVELSTGPLPLPPLAVGQTVALPIQ
jgi:hypothetical protein